MKISTLIKRPCIGIIIGSIIVTSVGCIAKRQPIRSKKTYFNQSVPDDSAVVFASGIVSTRHHEHSRLQFSRDGTAMYWAVIPVDSNNQTAGGSPFKIEDQNIWFSKLIHDKWTAPDIFKLTKISGGSTPAFSPDGQVFYYRSRKPDGDPNLRPRPSQLWKVSCKNGQLGKQEKENNLLPDEERKTYMSFCFADNGNLYFDYGGPGISGEWIWGIYCSEFKEGKYQSPVKLESGVNEGEASWCPWIAPDESYLIYSSHRKGEYGRGDLYIHFKDNSGNWSRPINMGPGINSEMQERFPSVSPDGQYLFFARHMPETFSDIFWVNAKVIDDMKQKQ